MDRYDVIEPGDMIKDTATGEWVRCEDVVKRLEEIREAQGPACVIPEELFEI